MKKFVFLLIAMGLILIGCTMDRSNSTKVKVYGDSWDENPIVVEKRTNNEDYEITNEITDTKEVTKLIKKLKGANWEENVDVDIEPAHSYFTWNSFKHYVWVNHEVNRLELNIEGRSNYTTLSKEASEMAFEILTGEKFDPR